MLAANAASAPHLKTSSICSMLPAPPLAMTGTLTRLEILLVSSMSNPALVPSLSMDVSSISPAPSWATFFAHRYASSLVSIRPPFINTLCEFFVFLASIATTTQELPNLFAACSTKLGFFIAAEFRLILSQPAFKRREISSMLRIPPPTVSGIKSVLATFSTI